MAFLKVLVHTGVFFNSFLSMTDCYGLIFCRKKSLVGDFKKRKTIANGSLCSWTNLKHFVFGSNLKSCGNPSSTLWDVKPSHVSISRARKYYLQFLNTIKEAAWSNNRAAAAGRNLVRNGPQRYANHDIWTRTNQAFALNCVCTVVFTITDQS